VNLSKLKTLKRTVAAGGRELSAVEPAGDD
jgi:hypothetical protein